MARSPESHRTRDEEEEEEVTRRRLVKGKQPMRYMSPEMASQLPPTQDTEDGEEEMDPTQEIEEENDENGDRDEDDSEGSPSGRKRARVNANGDSVPSITPKNEPWSRRALIRDIDDYVVGSVVRVRLHNFLTYDDVEFRPGPYLNMILGPNGTGKSSIACALCLGMGFPPSTLGRATELNAFVKNTTKEGFVEIELKGPPAAGNTIVKRLLTSSSRGSTFELNGQKSRQDLVKAEMKKLNVSVDNLCSFLPQDKVVEFARMSPHELLKQTERSAGDPRLLQWHDVLAKAGKEMKSMNDELNILTGELDLLRQQNEKDQHEVEAYRRRQQLERLAYSLDMKLHYQIYGELRLSYSKIRARAISARTRRDQLAANNKPLKEFSKSLEREEDKIEKSRSEVKRAVQRHTATLRKIKDRMLELAGDYEQKTKAIIAMKKNESKRRQNLAALRDQLAQAELKAATAPEEVDMKALKAEKAHHVAPLRQAQAVGEDVQRALDKKKRDYESAGNTIKTLQSELDRLNSVANRRLSDLGRWDRDCHDAVVWLRNNGGMFKQVVCEPAVLSLEIKEEKYTPYIESCFNQGQLRTFVCSCQEDYDLFNHYVNDTDKALGQRARVTVWYRPASQAPQPPLSLEEMQRFGFDGYAIDFVTCKPEFMTFLTKEVGLNRTPIKFRGDVDADRMREFMDERRLNIANWITQTTSFHASRSLYGQRLIQMNSQQIPPARNLGRHGVDQSEVNERTRRINEERARQGIVEEEANVLSEKLEQHKHEEAEFRSKVDEVNRKMERAQQAQRSFMQAKIDYEKLKNQVAQEEKEPSVQEKVELKKKEAFAIALKRIKALKEYQETWSKISGGLSSLTEYMFKEAQLLANIKEVDNLKEIYDKDYNEAAEEFKNLELEAVQEKSAQEDAKASFESLLNNIPEDVQQETWPSISAAEAAFKEAKRRGELDATTWEKSSDEYQEELTHIRAELATNLATNAGIIDRFEKREQKIKEQEEIHEKKSKACRRKENEIKSAKDEWHPALQNLVGSINQKFSKAFEDIGCVGEVRIGEHEDYDKWAIEILVKFRDSESLQLLDAQRQSGGERALTTIFYLMSLTEMARSPFSLVDEINQGMDQRAERFVHNQLVKVACAKDSGQYFLITPKLLPALEYHERMKILCVNNGEWLEYEDPEVRRGQITGGNMMKMLEQTLAKRVMVAAC